MRSGARLLQTSRGYATHRAATKIGGALSLDHFLQRSRTLSFYRTILRGVHRIGNPTTRAESLKYVRDEFERHRAVTDISHIRYLLSTGKTEWESMERYIGTM